jgi:hypothetical protein
MVATTVTFDGRARKTALMARRSAFGAPVVTSFTGREMTEDAGTGDAGSEYLSVGVDNVGVGVGVGVGEAVTVVAGLAGPGDVAV